MTRNRASAKKAGSRFERIIADWLRDRLDTPHIDRRVKTGAKDRGDIGGVTTIAGGRVCLELKDYGGVFHVTPWLNEIEVEQGNDDARVGAVIAKRRGVSDPAEQVVFLTLENFARLIEGGGDYEPAVVPDSMTIEVAA